MLNKKEPARAWRYHPFEPARIFVGEDLDNLPIGWVDTPDKFDEATAAIKATGMKIPEPVLEVKAVEAPTPDAFDSIDDFMGAFVAASVDLPSEGRQRDAALKAGIEQYVATKYRAGIDRRQSVESLRDQAKALDEQE